MRNDNGHLRRLERRLRNERPAPSARLMSSLTPRPAPRRQLAFAGALTAALAVALASVGGVSYAANAVSHAAAAAKNIVSPSAKHGAIAVTGLNAGGDQYKPGYGFGDRNHNHSGPPGLNKSGSKTPPAQVTRVSGKAILVTTSVTSDEQAAMYFSVLDKNGKKLLLTQKGSKVASGVNGPQTKSIHYVMLVPRTIPVSLRIPANLLTAGETYRIQVVAVDADGNKSETSISFTAP